MCRFVAIKSVIQELLLPPDWEIIQTGAVLHNRFALSGWLNSLSGATI
ncbi:hypothetical protein LR021_01920 [Candidatus Bipolaricaulota bacterium]|nr:hypothetical protein [Candidatus Bipolaricaulota bacterium]